MEHDAVIKTLGAAMEGVAGVQALFLGGSHGNGMADAESDIDFVLVSEDGASDALADAWRSAVAQVGQIVLWWDRTHLPVLINAITEDWMRLDLLMLKPAQMAAHRQDALKVVFDPGGIYRGLAPTPPVAAPDPRRLRHKVEDFIRVLGLLGVVEGRRDYINGVLGVFHLRNALVDLLVEETAAPHRGGMLHLNRLITDDQKAVLRAMPAPRAERDAVIAAHLAYAAAYLPRARKRAADIGMAWPEDFEAATWKRLAHKVGVEPPY